MSRSIFGWDLPPGCTMKDIDDAFGDKPDPIVDGFIEDKSANLTKEELEWLAHNYGEIDIVTGILSKLHSWAYEQGYQQGIMDEKQYQEYEAISGDE